MKDRDLVFKSVVICILLAAGSQVLIVAALKTSTMITWFCHTTLYPIHIVAIDMAKKSQSYIVAIFIAYSCHTCCDHMISKWPKNPSCRRHSCHIFLQSWYFWSYSCHIFMIIDIANKNPEIAASVISDNAMRRTEPGCAGAICHADIWKNIKDMYINSHICKWYIYIYI